MRSTIAIATVAAAAGTALASDNCRNFLASCDGIDLQFYGDRADQPWLHAGGGCGDGSGGRAYGFLELNKKFTNSFGNLQFKEEYVTSLSSFSYSHPFSLSMFRYSGICNNVHWRIAKAKPGQCRI